MSAWLGFVDWGTAWGSGTPTPPAPAATSMGGGYGRPAFKRKRLDQKVAEWVDAAATYAEIVAHAPKGVQREAGKIVRPFATEPKQKVPEPEKVDWKALERDAERVRALLKLWSDEADEMEAEEELLLLMH